jgi:hypothetical protein
MTPQARFLRSKIDHTSVNSAPVNQGSNFVENIVTLSLKAVGLINEKTIFENLVSWSL